MTRELLSELERCGVELWLDGELLRYRGSNHVLTGERVGEIRAHKPSLIELLKARTAHERCTGEASSHEAIRWTPMSGQEGLARFWQAHHVHSVSLWTGTLDIAALQTALNALIARHGALRTRYAVAIDDGISAITEPVMYIPVEVTDLRALPDPARRPEARRLTNEIVRRLFDRERGPLLRLAVLQLAECEFVVALVVHHSVFDAWSCSILKRELLAFYQVARTGAALDPRPRPLQFHQYVLEQNALLSSPEVQADMEYWRKRCMGTRPFWLPADRRSLSPSLDMPRTCCKVGRLSYKLLLRIAREERTTAFTCIVAVFGIILQQWRRVEGAFTWVLHSGRERAALRGVVGLLSDSWPLRMEPKAEHSFRALVREVRRSCAEAQLHLRVSPAALRRQLESRGGSDATRTILFNYVKKLPAERMRWGPDIVRSLDWVDRTGRFPPQSRHAMLVVAMEVEDSLHFEIQHNSGLFEDGTVEEVAQALGEVLAAVATNPDRPLGAHQVLGRAFGSDALSR